MKFSIIPRIVDLWQNFRSELEFIRYLPHAMKFPSSFKVTKTWVDYHDPSKIEGQIKETSLLFGLLKIENQCYVIPNYHKQRINIFLFGVPVYSIKFSTQTDYIPSFWVQGVEYEWTDIPPLTHTNHD